MNWKIFLSTFALIFIAELGDKTQLAAMARATTSESAKWTVFFAASSALVLSTLIAVLLGNALTRMVPERTIHIAAGILFIGLGVLILWRAFVPATAKTVVPSESKIENVVLRLAQEFERSAFQDYRSLADKVSDPAIKTLLRKIADEEGTHLEQLTESLQDAGHDYAASDTDRLSSERERLIHDVAEHDKPAITHAIQHERATANFYAELARLTPVPSLRHTFDTLANAELNHAAQLERAIQRTDGE